MPSHGEYAICPYCDEEHGDCWESITSEFPTVMTCQGCGKDFKAWACYDITYNTCRMDLKNDV